MCVMNIILHTLLLVDVCGNINTIFYSVVVYKDHYYSLKFFFIIKTVYLICLKVPSLIVGFFCGADTEC